MPDPLAEYGPYTEGDAWQYLWMLPHQADHLAELLGGKAAAVARLDHYFAESQQETPAFGIRSWYWHGNEPCMVDAWLYAAWGQPVKEAQTVDWILGTFYGTEPDGLAGNDDGGTMSAWLLFAMAGIYPVPGTATYWVGVPRVPKLVIHRPGGDLTIEATKGALKLGGSLLRRHPRRQGAHGPDGDRGPARGDPHPEDRRRGREALAGERLEPVAQEVVAVLREDRLGVELHALDGELAVGEAHDLALGGLGGDLEVGREGLPAHQQRVVAGGLEAIGEPGEDALAPVADGARLPVHDPVGADDLAAEGLADGLVAEAHPEDGQAPGVAADDLHGDPRVLRRARAPARGARPAGLRAATSSTVRASLRTTSTSAPSSQRYCTRFQVNES